jgi:voltage-gated potassium channel Kch
MEPRPRGEPIPSRWDLFVLALTILSLVNILLLVLPLDEDSKRVVLIIDGTLCAIFLGDFVQRLVKAESRRAYLRRDGWLDFIGSLPVPGFRLARVLRIWRAAAQIRRHERRKLVREIARERAQGAMYFVLLLVVLVLEFASIGVLAAERSAEDANITNASDALWWGYVTITTVGYGDQYPVTNAGRIVGVFLLTVGVGLFGTFTAFVANVFLAPRRPRRDTAGSPLAEARSLLAEQERTTATIREKLEDFEAQAGAPSASS